jgi:hypothetical protein
MNFFLGGMNGESADWKLAGTQRHSGIIFCTANLKKLCPGVGKRLTFLNFFSPTSARMSEA